MKPLSKVGAAAATALLAVLGVSACGATDSPKAETGTTTPSATASTSPTPSADGSASPSASSSAQSDVEPVVLTIKDFAYSGPGKVAPGTEITVRNDDDAAHTVTADGKGGFDVILPPGKSATFKAPSQPGSYDYFCTYHANMRGTLSVG